MSDLSNKRSYLTIIIATLNVEQTLEKCLDSIIHQTSINKIEIIIKDGRSNDQTIDIIKKYDRYIRYWETSSDSGVYDAWNKVLPIASGEWVLFLGGDDTLFDNSTIFNSIKYLTETDSSIDIAYGRVRLVSSVNEKIIDLGADWEKTKNCIKQKMCIPHQGIFHRSSLFITHGYFNTNYQISSDYDFIRRVLNERNIEYLDMIVSRMRVGGISSSPNNTFTRLKEVRQINSSNGSIIPGKLWLITFVNACFRYGLFLFFGEKSGKLILDRIRKLFGLPPFWSKT